MAKITIVLWNTVDSGKVQSKLTGFPRTPFAPGGPVSPIAPCLKKVKQFVEVKNGKIDQNFVSNIIALSRKFI